MDQDLKDALNVIVGMIDTLGKKVDILDQRMSRMEERMDRMEKDIIEIKDNQEKTNEKIDILSSMYGEHEIAIRSLKAKKII